MNKKSVIGIIAVLLLLMSCKKTKLEGELSVLVGTWKWKYTIATGNNCGAYFGGEYIQSSPSIVGYEYEMTFLKKGKLILKKGNKEKKYRIVNEPNFVNNTIYDTAFSFHLNRHSGVTVFYQKTSTGEYLRTVDLPEGTRDDCEARISLFEKVQ